MLLFGAVPSSAFGISMVARGNTNLLSTSDVVTVDVFLDSDGPVSIVSVAVVNSSPAAVRYDGPASAALPVHPGAGTFGNSTGAQSSYILYEPLARGSNYLVPWQASYFLTYPPETPGTEQINVAYHERILGTTHATGSNIYVATLVFHVLQDFSIADLTLEFTSSNLIQAGSVTVPASSITLSAPIRLEGFFEASDLDEDGVLDEFDNCPFDPNPGQKDTDGNGTGDACNTFEDADDDEWSDALDNCPVASNPNQANADLDTVGDACDNCPADANSGQEDTDGNGTGDACNAGEDADGDDWADGLDNCPVDANPNQADADLDAVGNACDNCPNDPNPGQEDTDGNGRGDVCNDESTQLPAASHAVRLLLVGLLLFLGLRGVATRGGSPRRG